MHKNYLTSILVGIFLFMPIGYASASVTINPSTGWSGYFAWTDGLGQIDGIENPSPTMDYTQKDWSITVSGASNMSLATAWDDFIPGDEFDFIVDGASVGWSSTYIDGSGYFHGIFNNLFLSAGTHTLTFDLTSLAPNFIDGWARAEFSQAVVPEPSTFILLGAGLAGLVAVGIRRKKS